MSHPLRDYWEALDRLKNGKPIHIKSGGRITNDTVSLEAGRGRGSIKKSRPIFTDLIAAIKEVDSNTVEPTRKIIGKIDKYRDEAQKYRQLWESALARELSLLYELHEVKEDMKKIRSDKVRDVTPR